MKLSKNALLVLIPVLSSLLLFVSAGGRESGSQGSATPEPSTLSANDRLPTKIAYPLKNAPKVTWWLALNANVSAGFKSLNDTPFSKALIERTGVPIEYIHPAQGSETEQFNLLVASGRMPDIVEWNWFSAYNGGPDAAIRNKLILPLNEVMDTWAPDYKDWIAKHADIEKGLKTDEGNYYGFPMILYEDPLLTTAGSIIRQDWLDELGLQRPETIDELTAVLKAFKEKKGASAPMALIGGNSLGNIFYQGAIIGAYKTYYDMYLDNGKIKYGPEQPSYKDAVRQMSQWYRDGLLDRSFASNTQKERDANILNGASGVTFGYCSSSMDTLNRAFRTTNPNAQLRGFNYPVLKKGETSWFGQFRFQVDTSTIAMVNPKSSNTEVVVKLLNYGYSDPGYYLYNFGVEGQSYNMKNSAPVMVDSILNPAQGSVGQAWGAYARSVYNGPFQQSLDFIKQYLGAPELQDALSHWVKHESKIHMVPQVSVSIDESRTYNKIKSDLNSYVLEWTTKAISGSVSIDEFDTVFLRTLKEIGVDEAVAIQQAALERYNKR
jgi:putative aldouronate transport system substrate-binding protein